MKRVRRLLSSLILVPTIAAFFLVVSSGGSFECTAEETPSSQEVRKPLTVIRNGNIKQSDPKLFLEAIEELGRLKAVEAVDDLLRLLTYERDWWREERTRQGYTYSSGSSPIHRIGRHYPATLALAEIGKAALPALVEVIVGYDEASLESTNANYTIRVIRARLGLEPDAFFEDAAAKAATPEAAQRLRKAIETLEDSKRQ